MRTAALLALVVATFACGAEPAPRPASDAASAPDASEAALDAPDPCAGVSCLPGSVCSLGACILAPVDASAPDAPAEASVDAAPEVDAAPDGPACAPGFGDCDGMAANGCEADLRASIAHCGRCGVACAPGANAAPVCTAGACGTVCAPGFADCNDQPGCETDVTTVLNCGGCGMSCPSGGGRRCCPSATVNRCPLAAQPRGA